MTHENIYKTLKGKEAEAHMKRLSVETTYLVDIATQAYGRYLEKSQQALDAPTPEEANTLFASAISDAITANGIWPTLLAAWMGSANSVNKVHEEFEKFANGKPN